VIQVKPYNWNTDPTQIFDDLFFKDPLYSSHLHLHFLHSLFPKGFPYKT